MKIGLGMRPYFDDWAENRTDLAHDSESAISLLVSVEPIHTSEYVYLLAGANALCRIKNFQWRKEADVYVIVSCKPLKSS